MPDDPTVRDATGALLGQRYATRIGVVSGPALTETPG
jgi:hypothetical protein